jgi:hypothetical protein
MVKLPLKNADLVKTIDFNFLRRVSEPKKQKK